MLQAAASLPYLLAFPAGALGDLGSRRNLLIGGQATMAVAAGLLGMLTLARRLARRARANQRAEHATSPHDVYLRTWLSGRSRGRWPRLGSRSGIDY